MFTSMLGVAGALGAVNYALGGRQKVIDQLSRLGTNVLNVTPQLSRSVAGRASTASIVTTLTEADYATLLREIPLFAASSAIFTRTWLIKSGDLRKNNCVVVGVEPEYMSIKTWAVAAGDLFDQSDVRRLARVVLLGSAIARDLFGSNSPLGARVTINRVPFHVIGVMTERGQSLDAANEDDQVYVPVSTAMRRLANVDYLSGIVFSVAHVETMDRAAAQVHEILSRRHVRVAKLPEDFQVQNQKQAIETRTVASDRLLYFIRWIALSALTVSGLGVLAIAWIGVKERTREIGTRRALGARRVDIFAQILWEALLVSVCGCGVGLALAWRASFFVARLVDEPAVFDQFSAWLAAGLSVGLNMLFAIIPARTAARLDPIQALRFD